MLRSSLADRCRQPTVRESLIGRPRSLPPCSDVARALVPTALIGLALGSAQVGRARADEAFDRFVDAYFAARFADRPSEGTAAGLHEYDTRLEDPSRPHVEQRIVELKDQLGRLQAFDRARLAFDEAIDAEVLDGRIRAELLDLETLRVWESQPDALRQAARPRRRWADETRVRALPAERLRSVIARERSIPAVHAAAAPT